MSFGNWADFTPENIRTYSEEKLLLAMKLSAGNIYDAWARAELERRRSLALQEATGEMHRQVTLLAQSSTRLEHLTTALVQETATSNREIVVLTGSSHHLEHLTSRLNILSWVLIILTVLAVATPIGIEVWHVKHLPEVKIFPPPPAPPPPTK